MGALGAVVDAPPTDEANLKPSNVELPPAVVTTRDATAVAGRHAFATSRSATTTLFLPAAFAR